MKPITKVFLIIAALVFSVVMWGLFFNTGGVIQTVYTAVTAPINTAWQNISGGSTNILPVWKIKDAEKLQDKNKTQTFDGI